MDVPIWTKFGSRMQNDTPITGKSSRSKPEVKFQHGGRLYFENGNSYISAANRDISTKFGLLIDFDILKAVTSTNTKPEVVYLYSALFVVPHTQGPRHRRHGSHSVSCNYTNAYLYLVSVHQMAPPQTEVVTSNCSLLLIYLPQKNKWLSRPGWLTYSGRFTYISG